jgi:hypothetical protein
MEEILPAKFGGASLDYQMVEEEDDHGRTRMSLLVSPKLGEIDEDELVKAVLGELSQGNDNQRMMVHVWDQAKTLRVKRMLPFVTMSGKLMPLHISKRK